MDWPIQLEYAEKLGLGSREYELIKILTADNAFGREIFRRVYRRMAVTNKRI